MSPLDVVIAVTMLVALVVGATENVGRRKPADWSDEKIKFRS